MQYKVPQNVDIEDKVIAGLTLRQFTYLMVAGGFVLSLKYLLPPLMQGLFVPLSMLIGGVGVAFAFIKINDRPFEIFIFSAFRTFLTPNKRIWLKEECGQPAPAKKEEPVVETHTKENLSTVRSNLQRLATLVDTGYQTPTTTVSDAEEKVHDILEKTEGNSDSLNKIMEEAKKNTTQASQQDIPISSLATVKPSDQFKYENISVKSEKELEEMLEKTKEKQKEKEESLKNQKIEKF